MKFSRKTWFMIILKVTKKRERERDQTDLPRLFIINIFLLLKVP